MAENDIGAGLSKLLEDPEALARVMSLASTLAGSMQAEAKAPDSDGKPSEEAAAAFSDKAPEGDDRPSSAVPDMSALPALLEGLGGGRKASDPSCALLTALKPYMAHGRAEKIDSLIKILKLSELAGGFLHANGIF